MVLYCQTDPVSASSRPLTRVCPRVSRRIAVKLWLTKHSCGQFLATSPILPSALLFLEMLPPTASTSSTSSIFWLQVRCPATARRTYIHLNNASRYQLNCFQLREKKKKSRDLIKLATNLALAHFRGCATEVRVLAARQLGVKPCRLQASSNAPTNLRPPCWSCNTRMHFKESGFCRTFCADESDGLRLHHSSEHLSQRPEIFFLPSCAERGNWRP